MEIIVYTAFPMETYWLKKTQLQDLVQREEEKNQEEARRKRVILLAFAIYLFLMGLAVFFAFEKIQFLRAVQLQIRVLFEGF